MRDEMLRKYELLCDQVAGEEALSQMEKMRGSYYRCHTFGSGTLLEVCAYPLLPAKTARQVRKLKPTREQQKTLNQINAEKRFTRLLEGNFGEGDYYMTMTITELMTLDEVHEQVKKYIRAMARERKKRGLPAVKYLYVIEGYEEGSRQQRLHVHLIVDGLLDRKTLKELWGRARTSCEELDPRGYSGLIALSKYLTKDPRGRKRWSSSKGNLKRPVERIADRKMNARTAWRIAENQAEASVALEKLYPGYEFIEMEVKSNPYIPGAYIYAIMRKKGWRDGEQGKSDRARSNKHRKQGDAKRRRSGKLPAGGEPAV